ncbi:MAG TPA: cyclic dehypoxanthinyl futalosine synthase [Armatimonadaceae bacterium]|nr:cyclic dehypoxanthinyl futalosine synthase [Armatimonadaceae bacterium]
MASRGTLSTGAAAQTEDAEFLPTLTRTRRGPESDITDIADRVFAGERLSGEDALRLFHHPNLNDLALLADFVRQRKNPGNTVTYVIGRNVNYTNVCWVRCKFCNFYRTPGQDGGYVLPKEEIFRKIREMVDVDGVELLMQGGLNPKLKIEYYEDLLSSIRERFPTVILHAFSPAELIYVKNISKLSMEETLTRLKDAGLHSVPGGGAEILVDRVRDFISPYKDTADEWLDCMRTAHKVGLHTSATMMYGSVDTFEDRVEHLLRLRDLQQESLEQYPAHFRAFIAWNYQPDGTELGGVRASGFDYLRTIAISRVVLDNFPHVQASWVTQGPKIGQISLRYGVDDFGSTMMEENVVSAAGCVFAVPIEDMERLIRDAGYEPRVRNTRYELVD